MPNCKNDSKKTYKGTEPSPKGLGYCAHVSKVGLRKKGKDGNMWVVKKISNGSKRWVKYSKKTTNSLVKRPKNSGVKSNVTTNKKYHKIIFCEPSTYMGPGLFVSGVIKVTPAFYETLKKKPKRKTCEYGNAYIFGKLHKKSDYKFIGSHGNDVAQTGFIDVDIWVDGDGDKMYKSLKGRYEWDNRKTVTDVQKAVPSVIWFGTTDGGDVGADLYAHYNKQKQIDGLIVENDCMFPRTKE